MVHVVHDLCPSLANVQLQNLSEIAEKVNGIEQIIGCNSSVSDAPLETVISRAGQQLPRGGLFGAVLNLLQASEEKGGGAVEVEVHDLSLRLANVEDTLKDLMNELDGGLRDLFRRKLEPTPPPPAEPRQLLSAPPPYTLSEAPPPLCPELNEVSSVSR